MFTCRHDTSLASASTLLLSWLSHQRHSKPGQGRSGRTSESLALGRAGRLNSDASPSQVDRDRPGCTDRSTRKAAAGSGPGFGLPVEPWQRTVTRRAASRELAGRARPGGKHLHCDSWIERISLFTQPAPQGRLISSLQGDGPADARRSHIGRARSHRQPDAGPAVEMPVTTRGSPPFQRMSGPGPARTGRRVMDSCAAARPPAGGRSVAAYENTNACADRVRLMWPGVRVGDRGIAAWELLSSFGCWQRP